MNNRFRRVTTTSTQATQTTGLANTVAGGRDAAMIQRRRLAPRDAQLMEKLRHLDAVTDPAVYADIMRQIREDFEARQGGSLIGLFAKCYLGPPYVDHRLDLFGSICEHFTPSDSVPPPYSQARGLAQSGKYSHIEIYTDMLIVPILPNGDTAGILKSS